MNAPLRAWNDDSCTVLVHVILQRSCIAMLSSPFRTHLEKKKRRTQYDGHKSTCLHEMLRIRSLGLAPMS